MATKQALNVLIVHGIGWGESGKNYAKPLQKNIEHAFEKAITRLRLRDVSRGDYRAKDALRFEAVYWSPVTQRPQDALIGLMKMRGWLFLRRLNPYRIARRQMVALLGDVISYEGGSRNQVYAAIHGRVNDSAEALAKGARGSLEDGAAAQLTVIGHSLGSVIASDYVWDSTRGADQPHHFRELPLAVKNMILLGSPMAIYALRNNPNADKYDISEALGEPVQVDPDGGIWLNCYDPQDAIAFPLRPIRSYAEAGMIDLSVRAGNWFTTLTPASHVGYWTSPQVATAIGRKLALDWAALNVEGFDSARYERELSTYRKDLRRG